MEENTFKTKSGYCHVLPDKIVLTRDGVVGNLSKVVNGNGIFRILILYSLISIYLLYYAYSKFQKDEIVSAILYFGLTTFLIYGIFKSKNNSARSIIERSKIKEVKFINGNKGVTRSRFEILFEDEKGQIKKRLVLLPGSLSDGENEAKNAIAIMKNENLIIE
ncbi:phosphoribosylaminoimidazolesuccinocarboxamide synthase [Flavobacterium sp.]|uniref:phosphoribosylaminoimidazolesuccinocarboxamide synthase n=1 Tax=Flavobacterium sp. TaxID=239 RepID=UPI00261972EE|nr:phosphoribosylaminoimidazolesuccinocarboxamide synthase [Flavobacterium sp.]